MTAVPVLAIQRIRSDASTLCRFNGTSGKNRHNVRLFIGNQTDYPQCKFSYIKFWPCQFVRFNTYPKQRDRGIKSYLREILLSWRLYNFRPPVNALTSKRRLHRTKGALGGLSDGRDEMNGKDTGDGQLGIDLTGDLAGDVANVFWLRGRN